MLGFIHRKTFLPLRCLPRPSLGFDTSGGVQALHLGRFRWRSFFRHGAVDVGAFFALD
jgi:hypothetical protein